MKHKAGKPLYVALFGMDERSCKTMAMFLQGPCKKAAEVVDAEQADVDIIDADFATAKDLFDERRNHDPRRPIIAMSLEDLTLDNTVFLKKPVSREGMLSALKQAELLCKAQPEKRTESDKFVPGVKTAEINDDSTPDLTKQPYQGDKQTGKKRIDTDEQKKTSKHQSAYQYNEGGFSAFIGIVPDIDFDDREQVLKASFNPKSFFLGYVKSAVKVAHDKARVVQLNSSWKPLLIFPHSHEVWLDAEEAQLRAFAGMSINASSQNGMTLSPVDVQTVQVKQSFDKFHSIDAFIWRLAIWASKGRFPVGIDIERPVYLRRWPDFTRLTVTPHALRIAALLIRGPRSLVNIAEVLKINPQYVFVFFSACHSLGLAGQAIRQSDQLISPAKIKADKSSGLFKKILGKLRATK